MAFIIGHFNKENVKRAVRARRYKPSSSVNTSHTEAPQQTQREMFETLPTQFRVDTSYHFLVGMFELI